MPEIYCQILPYRRRWCWTFKRWRVRGQRKVFESVSTRPKPSINVFVNFTFLTRGAIFLSTYYYSAYLSLSFSFTSYCWQLAVRAKQLTVNEFVLYFLIEHFLTFDSLSRENFGSEKCGSPCRGLPTLGGCLASGP